MSRLPYFLLLILLVSNVYAAENPGSPGDNNTNNESTTTTTDASLSGALANSTSNVPTASPFVKPFTVYKEGKRTDRVYRAAQMAFIGSIAADLGTTWTLPKGITEGNPLLGRNKAQQVSVSGALALLTLWEAHTLHTRGNTRAAKYLLWMGTVAHAFAGSYNAAR